VTGRRLVDWVQRRRDHICFAFWMMAVAVAMSHPAAREADLLRFEPFGQAAAAWVLLLAGISLRIWAAGNLVKNEFSRPQGPYCLARHPLYLGTLLISLGFFLSLGALSGLVIWLALLFLVFVPVMAKEERELLEDFPGPYAAYRKKVAALVPNLGALGEAWRTSRFSLKRSRANFGLRSLVFLPLVPALTRTIAWAHSLILQRQ
jgi:protein-S-isoprenylcysteine O-methyltransferase Ste14